MSQLCSRVLGSVVTGSYCTQCPRGQGQCHSTSRSYHRQCGDQAPTGADESLTHARTTRSRHRQQRDAWKEPTPKRFGRRWRRSLLLPRGPSHARPQVTCHD